jgi:hypothetical protein
VCSGRGEIESAAFYDQWLRLKIYSVAIGTCSIRDDYNAVLHSYKRAEVLCKFGWIFRRQPSSEDNGRESRSNFVAIRNFSGSFQFFIIK